MFHEINLVVEVVVCGGRGSEVEDSGREEIWRPLVVR